MIAPILLAALLQTAHPCDETPVTVTTRSPFTAGVCWSGLDEPDGNPSAPALELRVYLDGVLVQAVANPTPDGPPNAEGLSFYRVAGLAASRGARVLTFTVVNEVGESLPSDPFPFTVVGGKPAKPTKARVDPR